MFEFEEVDTTETPVTAAEILAEVEAGVEAEICDEPDASAATPPEAPPDALLVGGHEEPEELEESDESDEAKRYRDEAKSFAKVYDINEIYSQFVQNPDEDVIEKLMNAVTRLAAGVVRARAGGFQGYLNSSAFENDPTEISQDASMKVLRALRAGRFKGKSKFSTWCFKICKNTVLDAMRQIERRGEETLGDDVADEPVPGVGVSGSGQTGYGGEGTDHLGGSQGILPKNFTDRTEDAIIDELDYEKAYRRLTGREKKIVQLFRDGHTPQDIGKAFGRDAKWASNQLQRLKLLLQHGLHIVKSVFHTCQLPKVPVAELKDGELYVDDGNGGHRLLGKCKCRKQLTTLELKTLVDNGEAQPIYKTVAGTLVPCEDVWAPQLCQVPRVGLNSNSADIDRATLGDYQSLRDIEIAHEMSVMALRALIVPFRDDPWEGRVVFTAFAEGRTKGCFTKHQWVKPEPRVVPPEFQKTLVETKVRCTECGKRKMDFYEYSDGSRCYVHDGCSKNGDFLHISRKLAPWVSKQPDSTRLIGGRDLTVASPICEIGRPFPPEGTQVPSLFSSSSQVEPTPPHRRS